MEKPNVLRELDPEALLLARRLVRSARSVSLAVHDAESGFPAVSRALTATDLDGTPLILVSALAAHTRSLMAEPRCSLLSGEIGKGDPLAHARITLFALAEAVLRDSEDHQRVRRRFLNRHPKAQLYIDFPDFRIFRLHPQRASLNGGFGRAYEIEGTRFQIPIKSTVTDWLGLEEEVMIRYQNATQLAAAMGAPKASKYRVCGIDPAGVDLASGNVSFRYEFMPTLTASDTEGLDPSQILDVLHGLRKI